MGTSFASPTMSDSTGSASKAEALRQDGSITRSGVEVQVASRRTLLSIRNAHGIWGRFLLSRDQVDHHLPEANLVGTVGYSEST